MENVVKGLKKHESKTSSKWREEADFRRENKIWLRHSQQVAMLMLEKMEELNLTQTALAHRMNVTQQYVSKILKGRENLSLETLAKIESALEIHINIGVSVDC